MTSPAKVTANRANARRSTGPLSFQGKAHSSQNGLQHGLYSKAMLIRSGPLAESPREAARFTSAVRASFAPVGAAEESLADAAASLMWRLRRADRAEAAIIESATLPLPESVSPALRHVRWEVEKCADEWEFGWPGTAWSRRGPRGAFRLREYLRNGESLLRHAADQAGLLAKYGDDPDLQERFSYGAHSAVRSMEMEGLLGANLPCTEGSLKQEADRVGALEREREAARLQWAGYVEPAMESVRRTRAHLTRELSQTIFLLDNLQRRRRSGTRRARRARIVRPTLVSDRNGFGRKPGVTPGRTNGVSAS